MVGRIAGMGVGFGVKTKNVGRAVGMFVAFAVGSMLDGFFVVGRAGLFDFDGNE